MAGYRVRVEPDEPLAVDDALCRKQRRQLRLAMHLGLTVITLGLWSPVLIGWILTARRNLDSFCRQYAVTITGGTLTAGNPEESRSVPLDAVADVSVSGGLVTVTVRGAQPLQLLGLLDPTAAAHVILDAREEHVRGIRGDVREGVLTAEVGSDGRAGRRG